MKCSECRGDNLKTYDTRHIGDYVVRKRKCDDCDEKFFTIESYMTEEELEVVEAIRKEELHEHTQRNKARTTEQRSN